MSDKDEMISVSAMVLQDLIWNIQLNSAGIEAASESEKMIARQAEELQGYLTPEGYVDPNEGFSFDDFNKVAYANFYKRTWC
jgi:hypothetical protein